MIKIKKNSYQIYFPFIYENYTLKKDTFSEEMMSIHYFFKEILIEFINFKCSFVHSPNLSISKNLISKKINELERNEKIKNGNEI